MIVRKQNEENSCREIFWPMANLILRILKVRMEKAHQKRHVGGLRKKQMSTNKDQIISTLETVPRVGTNVHL